MKSLPNKPNNINEFMESAYNNSLFNIAMGCIFIEEIENMDIKSFNVYITQIFTGSNAYLFANTMLFISSFLKNEYDIDASILTNIEILENNFNKDEGKEEKRKDLDVFFLIIFAFSSLIGYILFLSGLIQDKIKERITSIKHLLYLSGCNMWSYWISFFIIDYLKLFIFNLILFLSAYFINESSKYFWINMIFISMSSLVFIYFISFFLSKEDSGNRFILLFFFVFIVLFIIYILLLSFKESVNPTDSNYINDYCYCIIFHITPITSMTLSFFALYLIFMNYVENDRCIYNPNLYKNLAIQSINFIFYSFLLILSES